MWHDFSYSLASPSKQIFSLCFSISFFFLCPFYLEKLNEEKGYWWQDIDFILHRGTQEVRRLIIHSHCVNVFVIPSASGLEIVSFPLFVRSNFCKGPLWLLILSPPVLFYFGGSVFIRNASLFWLFESVKSISQSWRRCGWPIVLSIAGKTISVSVLAEWCNRAFSFFCRSQCGWHWRSRLIHHCTGDPFERAHIHSGIRTSAQLGLAFDESFLHFLIALLLTCTRHHPHWCQLSPHLVTIARSSFGFVTIQAHGGWVLSVSSWRFHETALWISSAFTAGCFCSFSRLSVGHGRLVFVLVEDCGLVPRWPLPTVSFSRLSSFQPVVASFKIARHCRSRHGSRYSSRRRSNSKIFNFGGARPAQLNLLTERRSHGSCVPSERANWAAETGKIVEPWTSSASASTCQGILRSSSWWLRTPRRSVAWSTR